ncbi:MAG: ABC transporter ATP-binding protein [Granulosicoccus sp.]
MLLEVRGVKAGYGSSEVLFGIDLNVAAGECISLLGRNGMGKTTTLSTLMGLVEPRAGSIRIMGKDVLAWPSHRIARHGLALVPEGRQIFPNLTARENLIATAVAESPFAEPWTLDRVLALFPSLESRLDSMGNLLSGGEQQMLAIGRALMTNPRLLLLDDATEGLAPRVRDEIWRVLADLKRAGLAILIVDKTVDDLLPLVDRHHFIEKGKIVWSGDKAAMRAASEIRQRYLGV